VLRHCFSRPFLPYCTLSFTSTIYTVVVLIYELATE
jgi:hypothetical protein